MFTTRFARGTTCCGATLLLVAVFALVALSHSSQPEFEALSDQAMERLLGGEKVTKGNLIQSKSGSRANCNWPTSCPTEPFVLKPLIYSCFSCEPDEIEYRKDTFYKKVTSWCDNTLPTECPYKQFGRGKRTGCNVTLGSYC